MLNELKNAAQDKINELKDAFANAASPEEKTDLTRTADPLKLGTRHPLSLTKTKSSKSLPVSVSPLPKVLKLKMTGTCLAP